MNIEKLEELRDYLDAPKIAFNYKFWAVVKSGSSTFRVKDLHECGTSACLAGHTILLFDCTSGVISQEAAGILGLNPVELEFLFYWNSDTADISDAKERLEWLIQGNDPLDFDDEFAYYWDDVKSFYEV